MSDDLVQQCIAELIDIVRCRCHPAYRDRGMQDPDCECDSGHAVQVVADRIEELEAKLAKAVDFIEDLTGCEWPYDEGAKRILAELTGGKDG